jgi:hypothetical protein
MWLCLIELPVVSSHLLATVQLYLRTSMAQALDKAPDLAVADAGDCLVKQ